jgi:hypothetical protein
VTRVRAEGLDNRTGGFSVQQAVGVGDEVRVPSVLVDLVNVGPRWESSTFRGATWQTC